MPILYPSSPFPRHQPPRKRSKSPDGRDLAHSRPCANLRRSFCRVSADSPVHGRQGAFITVLTVAKRPTKALSARPACHSASEVPFSPGSGRRSPLVNYRKPTSNFFSAPPSAAPWRPPRRAAAPFTWPDRARSVSDCERRDWGCVAYIFRVLPGATNLGQPGSKAEPHTHVKRKKEDP